MGRWGPIILPAHSLSLVSHVGVSPEADGVQYFLPPLDLSGLVVGVWGLGVAGGGRGWIGST